MNSNSKFKIVFCISIVILALSLIVNQSNYPPIAFKDNAELEKPSYEKVFPKVSWFNNSEAPIFINGSATGVGAHNWTWARAQPWCQKGSGSSVDPYIIENITIDAKGSGSGIYIANSNNVYFTIRNCTISNSGTGGNNAGIRLRYTCNGTINNNNCSNNGGDGINLILMCNYNTISNNTILKNTGIGIYIYYSNSNIISDNNIYDNGYEGIYFWNGCENNTILGNTANNNLYGIHINNSYNNTISVNIANNNDYGIIVRSCNENIVTNNTANTNNYGIHLNNAKYTSITANNVNNNVQYGIHIYSSSDNNDITGNILIGNGIGNAYDECSNNQWDDGYGGNYWDDYSGFDVSPKDGIGDSNYTIDGISKSNDTKPLIYLLYDDTDNDGLNNLEEYTLGNDGYLTNVTNPDTDYDSFNDSIEIGLHTSPVNKWWYPMPNLHISSFTVEEEAYEGEPFVLGFTILNNGIASAQDINIIVRVETLNIILYNNSASPLDLAMDAFYTRSFLCDKISIRGYYFLTIIVNPYDQINETYSSKDGQLNADWASDNNMTILLKINIPEDDSKTDDDNNTEEIEAITRQVQQFQQFGLLMGLGIIILSIAFLVSLFVNFKTLKKTKGRNQAAPEKKTELK